MDRKHLVVLAIIGILIMALSIFGCQGYQAPEYKSPAEDEEELEEVDIDISDLGEEDLEEDEDFWDEEEELLEEELIEEDEEEPAYESEGPVVEPAATIKSYKPADDEEEIVYTTDEEEDVEEDVGYTAIGDEEEVDETEFKKSPYRPLVEEDLPTMTVTEGELVKLTIKATDADGDELTYEFTAPLNSDGEWQTRAGDSGVYYPEVTVSDGKTDIVKKLKIVVEPKNNKPVLQFIPNIEVDEGETVVLNPRASDDDGDRVTYSYSGWMSSNTKETGYQDAGVHKVTVSVTDGISIVTQDVTVTVKDVNRPPEVEIEF
jgi:hypothetical protein